jgi:hypothetical protein
LAGLYRLVAVSAPDLVGQLQALRQAAHGRVYPEDVDAVRAALFAVHGHDPQPGE